MENCSGSAIITLGSHRHEISLVSFVFTMLPGRVAIAFFVGVSVIGSLAQDSSSGPTARQKSKHYFALLASSCLVLFWFFIFRTIFIVFHRDIPQ